MSDPTPFANGTEERAWQHVWCEHCAHDHNMSHGAGDTEGCQLYLHVLLTANTDEWRWPEPWVKAPDFWKRLPADFTCEMFTPCDPCGGDPLAETRVNVRARIFNAVKVAS